MKGKKGFLLGEETLKIIIAIVGILLLVYLVVSIYYGNKNKEKNQAEDSLERISEEIDAGATSVSIYNPEGWRIVSWPYDNKIPAACSSEKWQKCLCICPGIGLLGTAIAITPFSETSDEFLEVCDKKGACVYNKKGLIIMDSGVQSPIEIANPPLILDVNYEKAEITKR